MTTRRDEPLQKALAVIAAAAVNDPDMALIAAKCAGLMRGYDARWWRHQYRVESVERSAYSELWNPETGARSRTFRIGGKLDLTVFDGNRYLLIDHKTTSEDIEQPDSPYWRQLVIEGQVSHYMLLEWLNGRKVDGAIWDVVRKPTINPKKLTKAEVQSAVINHDYYGYRISNESLLAIAKEPQETLELYEFRLAHDCMYERSQRYFQRRSIPRLDADLHEYAQELWEHSQDIILARRYNRHPRNSGACMLYGRPCKFLGICSGYDTPDSDTWRRKEQVHAEIDAGGDGRDLLTNSRIRMFQTCRRKHYYHYELGIERQEKEDRESLLFGTVFHAAQEAWWKAQKERNGNNDNGEAKQPETANIQSVIG